MTLIVKEAYLTTDLVDCLDTYHSLGTSWFSESHYTSSLRRFSSLIFTGASLDPHLRSARNGQWRYPQWITWIFGRKASDWRHKNSIWSIDFDAGTKGMDWLRMHPPSVWKANSVNLLSGRQSAIFLAWPRLSLNIGQAITYLADHLFSPGLYLAERIERGLLDIKGKTGKCNVL